MTIGHTQSLSQASASLRSPTSEVFRSGEFEERKKSWRKCACRIYLSGTLDGNSSATIPGRTTWEEAKPKAISPKTEPAVK